ncbi:hypothetical protein B296_00037945, partial [Ensete ventricosum]
GGIEQGANLYSANMRIVELEDGREKDSRGGEIAKVKAKRALVGAGARILFYPTLIYNVIRNKVQAEFHWWDEIDKVFFHAIHMPLFPNSCPEFPSLQRFFICDSLDFFQFLLLGAVPFPNDVPRLQQLGVRGVITLNEPYETLVPSSLYMVTFAFLNAFTSRNAFSTFDFSILPHGNTLHPYILWFSVHWLCSEV